MVVIVSGLPGSGKTFFAKVLTRALEGTYINSDTIRETFSHPKRYSLQDKNVVYDMMLNKMLKAIHTGKTVVLDATFYKNDFRRRFASYVKEPGQLHFIETIADEAVIKKRLSKRKDSQANFEVYQMIKAEWDPLEMPHLKVRSTDNNIEEMISAALIYLHPAAVKND